MATIKKTRLARRPVVTASVKISAELAHEVLDVLASITRAHDEGPWKNSRGRTVWGPGPDPDVGRVSELETALLAAVRAT